MKIFGYISLALGILNFVIAIILLNSEYADQAGRKFSGAIMTTVLGLFLISRSNKNKKEQEEQNEWKNNK